MVSSESSIPGCVPSDSRDSIRCGSDRTMVESSESPVTGCVTQGTRGLVCRDAEITLWGNLSSQMLTVARQTAVTGSVDIQIEISHRTLEAPVTSSDRTGRAAV